MLELNGILKYEETIRREKVKMKISEGRKRTLLLPASELFPLGDTGV